MVDTPLRRWLLANNQTITGLARILEVSRGRAQFWVNGAATPRGELLEALVALTGLTHRQLWPQEEIAQKRRLRRIELQARRGQTKFKPRGKYRPRQGGSRRGRTTHRRLAGR